MTWAGTYLNPWRGGLAERLHYAATSMSDIRIAHWSLWIGLMAAGLAAIWRRYGRGKAVALGMPFVLVTVASALEKYPITERVLVFLAPLTMLVSAVAIFSFLDVVATRLPAAGRFAGLLAAGSGALLMARELRWDAAPFLAKAGLAHPAAVAVNRDLIRVIESQRRNEPVYVLARAVPSWLFYTTDFRSGDLDRLRRVEPFWHWGGAVFGDAPPRGDIVRNEGDEMVFRSATHWDVIGMGSGMQHVEPHRWLRPAPNQGWAANEVRRMRRAANPRIWIYASECHLQEIQALQRELGLSGARIHHHQAGHNAEIWHVSFADEPAVAPA
jgi:hypothetical protein